MRSTLLLLASAFLAMAQQTAPRLVNLGRLSIARVFGPPVNTPFEARNAFDGGTNRINGFLYPFWDPTWDGPNQPGHVVVRFSRPVTVSGVVVEGPGENELPGRGWPDKFQVQIRTESRVHIAPWIGRDFGWAPYVPPQPISGVREVMVLVQGAGLYAVKEIEILGPPPAGVDLTPVTPERDAELLRDAQTPREAYASRTRSFQRTRAEIAIGEMKVLRATVDRTVSPAGKAEAWFALNRAADGIADWMEDDRPVAAMMEEVSELGVSLYWCEPGGHWAADVEGYGQYLRLLPEGPLADEAWIQADRFEGPRCGDFEGTPEEFESVIARYKAFLVRFPKSRYAPRMEKELAETQAEYAKLPIKK